MYMLTYYTLCPFPNCSFQLYTASPLFAWQIFGAGICLPLLGNIVGFTAAKIFRQPTEDCIAISIEIGVQNTALSLFLLQFALEPPAADISMIIPIAVSILTPVPMITFIIIMKIRQLVSKTKLAKEEISEPEAEKPENNIKLESLKA